MCGGRPRRSLGSACLGGRGGDRAPPSRGWTARARPPARRPGCSSPARRADPVPCVARCDAAPTRASGTAISSKDGLGARAPPWKPILVRASRPVMLLRLPDIVGMNRSDARGAPRARPGPAETAAPRPVCSPTSGRPDAGTRHRRNHLNGERSPRLAGRPSALCSRAERTAPTVPTRQAQSSRGFIVRRTRCYSDTASGRS